MKIKKEIIIFLLVLVLGIFLRSYRYKELFMYSHDQDLSSWVIRDIVDGHLRLIGQETSVRGVFIGGLFYYLLIPFFLLFRMDPIGGVLLPIILSIFSITSIYFVFKKIFNPKVATTGTIFYSLSYNIIFTEREVVPTMPVLLWSTWYLYAVWLVLKGKQKQGFLLSGMLVALIWHINLGLSVLILLLPVSLFLSKKKVNLRSLISGLVLFVVFSLPLVIFELRHNFIQTRAILLSLAAKEQISSTKLDKLGRVLQLTVRNISNVFGTNFFGFPQIYVFAALLAILGFLIIKKAVDRRLGVLMLVWLLVYILFFTFNAIIVSEYYLNGMTIVWILIASLFVNYLLRGRRYRDWAYAVIWTFVIINMFKFFTLSVNRSGYVYRRALVSFIKDDSQKHDYPCISISYITDPGYELGYRYLFRIEKMHVNRPSSGSPVYTIVFPHSLVGSIDKSFGALGLIYPDYKRYSPDEVSKSCLGEDANLTDPLFGFTR